MARPSAVRRGPTCRHHRRRIRAGVLAGAGAGVVSGAPSTVLALWHHTDLTTSARAAGALLGRPTLTRGALAHTAISLGWGVVLGLALPRRHRLVAGTIAGAGIAVIDLGVVGRRIPEIRALPQLPQLLDHLAYGAVAGLLLSAIDPEGIDRGADVYG